MNQRPALISAAASEPTAYSNLEVSAVPTSLIEGDPIIYKYHPRTTLALGRGFVPNDIFAPRRSAIKFTERSLDAGAPQTHFKMVFVQTEDQLDISMSLDSKAEAAYLGAKAEGRSTFKFGFGVKQNSVVIVMTAFTDFGRWALADECLTEEAKAQLSDPQTFIENFGSRYVAMERRGALVSAVITMETVDFQTRADFESEFGGKGSWGDVGGSAKTKLTAMLKLSAKQGRLDIEVMATGGQGLSGLKDLVKGAASDDDNPLASVQNALAQYLSGFEKNNASPIEYMVAPMKHFGLNEAVEEPWSDANERQLLAILREYRLTREAIDVFPAVKNRQHVICTMAEKAVIDAIISAESALNDYSLGYAQWHKTW